MALAFVGCGGDSSGGASPTASATATAVASATTTTASTSTQTPSATPTRAATATETPSPSATATATATATPTLSRDQACADLAGLDLAETSIAEVERVAAGEPAPRGFFPAPGAMPAHCVVRGEIGRHVGVDGVDYAIGFELRLPEEWSGRFLFQGGAGTDGLVAPATGPIPLFAGTAAPALARGYAVASTDAGHDKFLDPSFGLDPQARTDFFYAAIERTAIAAEAAIERYYGRAAEHAYVMGCSNGGRQAMVAAERFPNHFDGAVAGDPAFDLTRVGIAEAWDTIAFTAIAPRDEAGGPILSRAFSDADLTLLGDAVLARCDALDGLADGIIDDARECTFDPAVLRCAGEKTDSCLSGAQVAAIAKVFEGAKSSRGEALYSDWPYDAGIAGSGWRAWKLGTSPTATPDALNVTIGFGAMGYLFFTPPDPGFDPLQFDFDTDPPRTAETAALLNADSTDLGTFQRRGGKLLLYQGIGDPVFSANDLIAYYDRLGADNGGAAATRDWARLFLVPGMNHCGGGPALDAFDPLSALEQWVEHGTAPERLTAVGAAFPGRSRPLCAYPEQAHYAGSGSTEEAGNFDCREASAPEP